LTPGQLEPQEPTPPKVSAVVVSHDRVALLRRCLESMERAEARDTFGIIVVDNGSSDGSGQLDDDFPSARFIRLPKNFGLTKALNIGIRSAETEYVLLLHEDTEVEPGAVRILTETMEANPEAAAVCPLLVDAQGAPAPQLGELPPDGQYRPAAPGEGPTAVQYPRGAALMLRTFVIRSMRQIDERYGQFGSDADLAQQVRRGSKKILLVPSARVLHHGREEDPAIRRADFRIGRAVWIWKYLGFGAGVAARIGAILQPFATLKLGEFRYTAVGQKIDGSQS
jgi:GT2 family glycosyltransferase